MFCGVNPRDLLPRRFVLRPGVVSPLTCRHPRHVRCNCHGDFPQTGVASAPKPAKTSAAEAKKQAEAERKACRSIEHYYDKLIGQLLFAVREFPDAAKRVIEVFQANPVPLPEQPEAFA